MEYFINTLQLAGGIILALGYIPQIKKAISTKSMKDFNGFYLMAIASGLTLMEVYAVYNALRGVAFMFFVTNTLALILAVFLLILYLVYRKKEK